MKLTGEYRIPAARAVVWDALNDPDVLAACLPGVESLEKTSDTSFAAKVGAKVGPVKATFTGAVTLSDIDPPNGYRISGEGQGGVAGFAKGAADVTLAEDGTDTVLTYQADAQVGGKLAQIGSRLVTGTARKMADEFFGNLVDHIAGAAPEPTPEAAASDILDLPTAEPRPGIPPLYWIAGTILVVAVLLAVVL